MFFHLLRVGVDVEDDGGFKVEEFFILFEELFALFDKPMEDYIKLVPLKPWYRLRFNDGEHFDYGGSMTPPELIIEDLQKL